MKNNDKTINTTGSDWIISHTVIPSDPVATKESYLINCIIRPKKDDGLLFNSDKTNQRFWLDGYAIIPIEEYNKLKADSDQILTEEEAYKILLKGMRGDREGSLNEGVRLGIKRGFKALAAAGVMFKGNQYGK